MILIVNLNMAIDKTYTVPDYSVNKVYRPKKFTYLAGGKGVNVARVMKTLGVDAILTGFIGKDNGQIIMKGLKEKDIQYDFQTVNGQSRCCMNVLDPIHHTSTEILEKGPNILKEPLDDFLSKYKKLCKQAHIIVLSGSIPNGVPSNIYQTLIEEGKKQGAMTFLDTSKDPLKEGIKAIPYLVKPNIFELEELAGRTLPTLKDKIKVMKDYMKKGINYFILSMGQEGFLVGKEDEIYKVESKPIEAINPVGCGDALLGGFCVGIKKHMDFKDILRLSASTATSNALHYGAGMIHKDQVKDYIDTVKITKL